MDKTSYRLKTPTIAVLTCDGEHKFAITIPEGDTVEVEVELHGNRLVDVRWNEKMVMMFTVDLQTRGERVISKGSSDSEDKWSAEPSSPSDSCPGTNLTSALRSDAAETHLIARGHE